MCTGVHRLIFYHFVLFIIRLNQIKSELEGDKKAKIDEWKNATIPVEEWLVEENNKFDLQALSPGPTLDVVREKRKENEVSQEKGKTSTGEVKHSDRFTI